MALYLNLLQDEYSSVCQAVRVRSSACGDSILGAHAAFWFLRDHSYWHCPPPRLFIVSFSYQWSWIVVDLTDGYRFSSVLVVLLDLSLTLF